MRRPGDIGQKNSFWKTRIIKILKLFCSMPNLRFITDGLTKIFCEKYRRHDLSDIVGARDFYCFSILLERREYWTAAIATP